MIKLRLPYAIVSWTKSFLEERAIRLAFDGQVEKEKKIETGVPQGSPISPILFLIYIRDLFYTLEDVYPLSYINAIGLITALISLRKNVKILEREVKKLTEEG